MAKAYTIEPTLGGFKVFEGGPLEGGIAPAALATFTHRHHAEAFVRAMLSLSRIYLIDVASAHFTFTALGTTAEDAMRSFGAGLEAHAEVTGADPEWVAEMIAEASPQPREIGACYRDGFKL